MKYVELVMYKINYFATITIFDSEEIFIYICTLNCFCTVLDLDFMSNVKYGS